MREHGLVIIEKIYQSAHPLRLKVYQSGEVENIGGLKLNAVRRVAATMPAACHGGACRGKHGEREEVPVGAPVGFEKSSEN